MAVSSHSIGPQLLRLLGIDSSRCRRAVITLEVDAAVIVDVEMFAEEPKDGELETLAKRYIISAELIPDQEQEPVEASTLGSLTTEFLQGKQLPSQASGAD